MSPAEKRLTAALLRLAADQFANHGCNDFDMAPFFPNKDKRDALFVEVTGELYDGAVGDEDYRLSDSELMDLMADHLEREANEAR